MKPRSLACVVFTDQGKALAEKVLPGLTGWEARLYSCYGDRHQSLSDWVEEAFATDDALLFVGATGIAVRSIAPHVQSKMYDPAVVVVDEKGKFSISLLSGHVGGANELSARIADLCAGEAVITTATDVQEKWAVDVWAVRNNLSIQNPAKVKEVSAKILRGEKVTITIAEEGELLGGLPDQLKLVSPTDQADVVISPYHDGNETALSLIPVCIVAGIGCKKGSDAAIILEAFERALQKAKVYSSAVCEVHSIDLKQQEPGLIALCNTLKVDFITHSAGELRGVEGSLSQSSFVEEITGVDNVCERSALAGGGTLILHKMVYEGVTVALAIKPFNGSFEERS